MADFFVRTVIEDGASIPRERITFNGCTLAQLRAKLIKKRVPVNTRFDIYLLKNNMRVPNSTYLPIGIYYDKDMTYLGSVVRTMSKQTHHKWCWQISAKRRYIKADGSLYSKQELEKIAQKGVW